MKSRQYWKSIAPFKLRLRDAISHDELKRLHLRRPGVHLAYAARQFGIIAGASVAMWSLSSPLAWLPLAILQGFTFFNMTTLLHEVVHNSVFAQTRPRWTRFLGLIYATTSGISASQFTRWHLDHHDNLGTDDDDPKRHWLSPKRNARWYKLLYCTPMLMPLYFRAATREARSYPDDLRQTIRRERLAAIGLQLGALAALLAWGGPWAALKIQIIPYFLVFPVAFTLNRLGQHYAIDPDNPLKWSTVMAPSRMADFLFLYSNYHAEHHYFPAVPFYNLRRLHFLLRPFYAELGVRPRTYRELVWRWFVLNRRPHTDWNQKETEGAPAVPAAR